MTLSLFSSTSFSFFLLFRPRTRLTARAAMPPVEPAPAAIQTMPAATHAGHMASAASSGRESVGGISPAILASTRMTFLRRGFRHRATHEGDGLNSRPGCTANPDGASGPVAAREQESPDGVVLGQTDGPVEGLGRGDPPV